MIFEIMCTDRQTYRHAADHNISLTYWYWGQSKKEPDISLDNGMTRLRCVCLIMILLQVYSDSYDDEILNDSNDNEILKISHRLAE